MKVSPTIIATVFMAGGSAAALVDVIIAAVGQSDTDTIALNAAVLAFTGTNLQPVADATNTLLSHVVASKALIEQTPGAPLEQDDVFAIANPVFALYGDSNTLVASLAAIKPQIEQLNLCELIQAQNQAIFTDSTALVDAISGRVADDQKDLAESAGDLIRSSLQAAIDAYADCKDANPTGTTTTVTSTVTSTATSSTTDVNTTTAATSTGTTASSTGADTSSTGTATSSTGTTTSVATTTSAATTTTIPTSAATTTTGDDCTSDITATVTSTVTDTDTTTCDETTTTATAPATTSSWSAGVTTTFSSVLPTTTGASSGGNSGNSGSASNSPGSGNGSGSSSSISKPSSGSGGNVVPPTNAGSIMAPAGLLALVLAALAL